MRFSKSGRIASIIGAFCLLFTMQVAAVTVVQDEAEVAPLPERIDVVTEPGEASVNDVRFIMDNQECSPDTFEWVDSGISGKALKLDGHTQHLRLAGAQVRKLSSFTFSAWVNQAEANSATEQFLLSFFRNRNYRLQVSPNSVNAEKGLNGIHLSMEDPQIDPLSLHHVVESNVSSALPPSEWHHIAVSFSPEAVKLYVDGHFYLGHEFENFAIESIDRYRFVIGTEFDGEAQFAGLLDNVFVYTDALDGEQIRLLSQNIEPVKGVTASTSAEILATKPYTEPSTTAVQEPEVLGLGVPPMLIAVLGICIVLVAVLSLVLTMIKKRLKTPPEEDHP
ncbi:MAG: LamG domain-containing protein [Clostridia bacterium]|nr:LamG domain-containing protein [Clostridia bacterium]